MSEMVRERNSRTLRSSLSLKYSGIFHQDVTMLICALFAGYLNQHQCHLNLRILTRNSGMEPPHEAYHLDDLPNQFER